MSLFCHMFSNHFVLCIPFITLLCTMFQLSAINQPRPVYFITKVAGRNLNKPCISTLLFCQLFYFAIEDILVVCIDPQRI